MVPARGMNMKRLLLLAVCGILTMSPVAMAGTMVFEDDFSNDQSGWPNTTRWASVSTTALAAIK